MVSKITLKKIYNTSVLEELYKEEIKKVENKDLRHTIVKLKSNKRRIFRDCYEYFINNEPLSEIITREYQLKHVHSHPKKKLKFLEYNSGIIGSFGKMSDKFSIDSLLLKVHSKNEIADSKVFKEFMQNSKGSNEYYKQVIENIYRYTSSSIKWIYISVDGDEFYGGWGFKIKQDKDLYVWNDSENKLNFRFDKNQYEKCFNSIHNKH